MEITNINVFITDYPQNENLVSIDTFCINNDCRDALLIEQESSNLITFDTDDAKQSHYGYFTALHVSFECYEGICF